MRYLYRLIDDPAPSHIGNNLREQNSIDSLWTLYDAMRQFCDPSTVNSVQVYFECQNCSKVNLLESFFLSTRSSLFIYSKSGGKSISNSIQHSCDYD